MYGGQILSLRIQDGRETTDTAPGEAVQPDLQAFGTVYLRYANRIYRYLRLQTGEDEEAADLTQQVFLQALDALPRYDSRGIPIGAWLFRIARNAAIDHHRRRRITVDLDLLPERLEPLVETLIEDELVRQEALERLRCVLAELTPEKRELLAFRFAGGLTGREIAAITGKGEAAVHKHLKRTIETLRERYHAD